MSGNLLINVANVYNNGNQMRVYGNNGNTVTFSNSVISGVGSFAILENSVAQFMSAMTYTGDSFINAGTLRFSTGGSANSSTIRLGDTTGSANATLRVDGGVTLSTGDISVRSGSAGTKTINTDAASGSTATITRNVYLDADVAVSSSTLGGTLAFNSGTFDLKNQTMTLSGPGNITFTNAMSQTTGSGKITLSGNGVVTMLASSAYTGATTLGSGTLRVGNNSALGTGGFTINGGTFASDGGTARVITNAVTMGGNVTLGDATGAGNLTLSNINLNAATRQLTVGNNTTVAGVISNGASAAGLTKAGNGTLTFNGANTYTGATTVNAGVLTLGGSSAIAGDVTVSGGTFNLGNNNQIGNTAVSVSSGTLNFGGFTDGVSSFNISGSGVFTNGTLSAGSYALQGGTVAGVLGSGGITVTTGTTALGSAGRLNSGSSVAINSGQLTVAGNESVAAFSGSGGTLSVSSGTFTTTFNTASNNYGGTITGAGGFAKAGSGTLSLSGDASGIGAISVSAGRLQIGTGSTTGTIGNDNVSLSSGANLAFNRSDNITYNGQISGAGGTLTKLGNATLTISNTQTYTGATTVSAGTLAFMGTNTSTATTVQSGGTLSGSGSLGAVTIANGGTLNPGASPGTLSVGSLTWEGGGNYNWQVYDAAGAAGTGYDTISGDSLNITATEGTRFNINLWSLSGISPDANGSAINFTNTNSYAWTLGSFTNGITNFAANLFSINTAATNGTAGFANTFTGVFSLYTTNSTNLVLAYTAVTSVYDVTVAAGATDQGAATGGTNLFTGASALNKLGAGTLIMTNPLNDYAGVTTVKEGTMQINVNAPSGSAGALGNAITAVLVGDSSTNLAAGFNIGVANVTNSRNLTMVAGIGAADRIIGTTITSGQAVQAGGITFNTNTTLNAASGGTMLYSGLLTGSGNLTISNSGTSVFSASNTYSGTTTILNGSTLRIADNNALGTTAGNTVIDSGGVLDLTNAISSAEAITLNGTGISSAGAIRNISGNNTLSGNLTLGAASRINSDAALLTLSGGINGANHTLTVGGSGNTTINSTITNSTAGLTKDGSGTLTLSGNNTFSGVLTVASGKLTVETINNASANGVLGNSANAVVLGSSGQEGFLHYTGGTASSTKTFTAASGGTAGLEVSNAATTLTLSGAIGGSGGVTKGGAGILHLTGENTFSGALNIHAGTLRVDALNSLGANPAAVGLGKSGSGNTATFLYSGSTNATSSRAFDLVDSGGLGIISVSNSGTALTLGGLLSGSGRLEKAGTGTLVLSDNNTYSGTTLVSAGTLSIGSGSTAGSLGSSTITNNATLLFNRSDNLTQGTVVHGSGALHKAGAGTLTLSQANTYTGATTISNGAIRISNGTGLGTTAAGTTVNSGAALEVANGISSAEALNISGTGVGGNGALRNISGANTNSGTVTLAANATIKSESGTHLSLNNVDITGAVSRSVTFDGAGTNLVTGSISTSPGSLTNRIVKSGGGELVISNNGTTGTGQLRLGEGTVVIAAGSLSTSTSTATRAVDIGLSGDATGTNTAANASFLARVATVSNSIYIAPSGGDGSFTRTIGTDSTSGTITFNNQMYLGANVQITSAGTANVVYSGNITNDGTLNVTKIGAGSLTLSANNTWRGGLIAAAGTTILSGGNAVWDTNAVVVSNGANLVVGTAETIGSLAGAGTVTLGGNDLTTGENNANTNFSGTISGSSGSALIKNGSGTMELLGDNNSTFAGNIQLRAGALKITNANSLGSGGTVLLGTASSANAARLLVDETTTRNGIFSIQNASTGGVIEIADSKAFTITGALNQQGGTSDATRFEKRGAGTLILAGTSSGYAGQIRISDGTLVAGTAGALGGNVSTSTRAIDLGIDLTDAAAAKNVALLISNGVSLGQSIYVGPNTVGASNYTRTIGVAGASASITNQIYLGGNLNFDIGAASLLSVSNTTIGALIQGAAGRGLTKTGTGTLLLAGASTFDGGSTLSAGVLRVAHNNALGTGALTALSNTVLEVTNGITVTNNLSVYSVKFLNGGNTLSGTITNNNSVYDVPSGTTNVISGFVTGTGGVELIGGGQLNLTGATNNYTGNTVISNGTLQISTLANSNNVSSIGVSNNITLAGANATNAVLDYTGGNVTTDRTFVLNNGGGTINMASNTTNTLTGSASGTGTLIVGEGTLVLSNGTANSFAPGSIQVDSGATLQLAANDQIGNTTGLILNGGTFRIGTASTGFSDTLGTLTLSASSTIDLGAWTTGLRQLTFANSSAISWAGTLTITNWQGLALQSSDVAEVLFGTGGLTSGQLAQVSWANQGVTGGTLIGGNGELVPVPEPRVYAAAVALLAVVGWRERKRVRDLLSKALRKKA